MADLDLSAVPGPWTTSFVPGASGKLTLDPVLHAEVFAYIASGVTMTYELAAQETGAAAIPLPSETYHRVWESGPGLGAGRGRGEVTFAESGGTSAVVYVRVVAR